MLRSVLVTVAGVLQMCPYPLPTHLVLQTHTDDSIISANMDDILHNNVHQVDVDSLDSHNDVDDGGEGGDDGNMCVVTDGGARVRCQDDTSAGQELWRLSHSVLC